MTNNTATANAKTLPENPVSAVQYLIKSTQRLLDMSEQETQSLLQNNALTFAVLQDEKERLVNNYVSASAEFRDRIEEFRSVDKSLIKKLEKIQHDLGEKARANNKVVAEIRDRSEQNTAKTLLSVQELSQKYPIRMASRSEVSAQQTKQQGAV